jgi:hypothetical protein
MVCRSFCVLFLSVVLLVVGGMAGFSYGNCQIGQGFLVTWQHGKTPVSG